MNLVMVQALNRMEHPQNTEAEAVFKQLYSLLGRSELKDAIRSSMEDLGYSEWIEDYLELLEELA